MNDFVSLVTRLVWPVLILLGLGVARAEGQDAPDVLNPKTYRAPAGLYSLKVDPSNRHGEGKATYQLYENGKERWSATLPFTLWDAGVTDGGLVAGYAYSHGPSFGRDNGDFIVVILNAEGKIRLQESIKREPSQFLHRPANPIATGLIVDGPNDRMIVRIHDADLNRGEESWWIYRLSTATAVEKLNPAAQMENGESARSILDAKSIPGTPLVLVHWWRYDDQHDGSVGARFALIDLKGKPIWSLELPRDYMVPADENAEDKLRNLIRERGGIVKCDKRGQFDLLFAAESKRVTFSVKQGEAGKWAVAEIARKPYAFAESAQPQPSEIPNRPLKYLGPLVLQAKSRSGESPFRNVRNFVFDNEDRIAYLREESQAKQPVLVLADLSGKLLREIPLQVDVKPDSTWTGYCSVGSSRYVITNSDPGIEAKSQAWWVDTINGELQAIVGFDCPSVDRLVGFPDGGFVALATMRYKYTLEKMVIGFDNRGQRIWTLNDDSNDEGPNALFGVQDIANTSQNQIVVLENIPQIIKCFDRRGRLQSKIDVEKAWGREPSYLSRIATDIDGGFIVEDSGGEPPFVRMKRDGKLHAGITPKYADGRAVDTLDGIQTARDGRLWACDGDALVRLTDKGVVDLVLGQAPQSDELGKIAGITIDRQGQIYAVDSRTGSIHVFDAKGSLHHICQTRSTDVNRQLSSPAIAVNSKGEVYLGLGDDSAFPNDERQFAHFSADGTRLANVTLLASQCYFQPGTDNIVAMRYEEVLLISSAGETIRTIRRRPNGDWLGNPRAVSLAGDGSLAILDANPWPPTVNLYNAKGEPIRTIPLPQSVGAFPRIAYDGHRVLIAGDSGLLLIGESGMPLQTCTPPQMSNSKEAYWYPFLVADGRELILFDGKTLTLHRFEMP